MIAADLDGKYCDDIIMANFEMGRVTVLMNRNCTEFEEPLYLPSPYDFGPQYVRSYDFDSDGDTDIAVIADGELHVYFNNSR